MNGVWKGSNSNVPLPVSMAPNNLLYLFIVIIMSFVMHLCVAFATTVLYTPSALNYSSSRSILVLDSSIFIQFRDK